MARNWSGKMPVILMQWGNTVLIGVQPELSASTGAYIRSASPFPNTFIMTMVDGADKYLPDSSNYDHFTYESRSSPMPQEPLNRQQKRLLIN